MVDTLTNARYAAALKEYYTPEKMKTALFTQFPFLEQVKKIQKAEGKYFVQPVQMAPLARRSGSYSAAYAQSVIAPVVSFSVGYITDYSIVTIDGGVLRRAKTDRGTFADAMKLGMEDGVNVLRKSIASKLPRNGSGRVAQLGGSSTSSTNQTLLTVQDVWLFEKGDYVTFSATTTADGTGALRDAGTAVVINGVREDGVLNFSVSPATTVTSLVNSDFIFLQGDEYNNDTYKSLVGLNAWAPSSSSPLTTTFMNVLRSAEQRRLAGLFVDNSGNLPIDEILQDGVQRLQTNKGKPTAIWMNPVDFTSLAKTESTKVMRDQGGEAQVGFKGISIITSMGPVKVYTDPTFQVGNAYALDMDAIALVSLGDPCGFLDEDGQTIRKIEGQDAYQMSLGGESNLIPLKAPGQCIANIKLY